LPPYWEHFKKAHKEIESSVGDRKGSYQGLSKEALSTDVSDLRNIFLSKNITGTYADLGCGTGESVLLYAELFPERKAIGIDFEEARILATKEFALPNSEFIVADLLTCEIPEAQTYFLYFPTGPVLDRILTFLYESKNDFHLIVIESHGDLLKRIDLENWLVNIEEIPLSSARHYAHARIYKRLHLERSDRLQPFTLSYQERFLIMNTEWVGETFGMEWTADDRFELETPPRTIHWKDVKKLMILEDFPLHVQKVLSLRREGELNFELKERFLSGFIRKIILNPSFALELSNGEKVEWTEILTIRKGSLLCYDSSQAF
jgi:SAM-dependent methyltransferase